MHGHATQLLTNLLCIPIAFEIVFIHDFAVVPDAVALALPGAVALRVFHPNLQVRPGRELALHARRGDDRSFAVRIPIVKR